MVPFLERSWVRDSSWGPVAKDGRLGGEGG